MRYIFNILLKIILFNFFIYTSAFSFNVHIIDIGQGSSTLIQTSTHTGILVDAGRNRADDHLITYLESYNIDTLSSIVISHPDADHIGEVEDLLQSSKFVVKKVIKTKDVSTSQTYARMINEITIRSIPICTVSTEDTVFDEITIWNGTQKGGDLNHRSLVVEYTDSSKTILIMGDCDSTAEKDLLHLRADMLVVGHHGASQSTCGTFLDSVSPKIAFISVGNNSYGHPTPSVLSRLSVRNIDIFRTDQSGDLFVTVSGGTIYVNDNSVGIKAVNHQRKVLILPNKRSLRHRNILGQLIKKANSLTIIFNNKEKYVRQRL